MISRLRSSAGYIVGGLLLCVLVHNIEKDLLERYVTSANLELSLRATFKAENDDYLSQQHVADMKLLIGNVAHDLKTPLQGIMSNLELIEKVFDRLQLNDLDNSIRVSLDSCLSICNFMSMAVNRTIDFSKSSASIELNPKHESVDIHAAINWSLNCVRHFIQL